MDGTHDAPAEDAVDRIVAAWARERPELDTAPAEIVGRIGRLRWYLDGGLERTFRRFGLTRAAFDVLAALRRSGLPYRLPQKVLMGALMRTSGTTSFRIDRLESQGLVRREADPDDGRGVFVALTKKGLRLVDSAAPAHLANEAQLLAALSAEERVTLVTLLRKLLLSFEAPNPPSATEDASPPTATSAARASRPSARRRRSRAYEPPG